MRKSLLLSVLQLFVVNCLVLDVFASNATIILPTIPKASFPITNYGANSASTDNTVAIQSAIDSCEKAGGGSVIVPSGTFLCGPIELKNNVDLELAAGSVLKMLPYGKGNGEEPGSYPNAGKPDFYTHFISAKNVSNIKVSGSGTIDGQGEAWWIAYRAKKAIKRGCLIRFDACKYIEISGITLQNAPNVHITIGRQSSDATISRININCPETAPNSDGIDTWAPNIQILDSKITCGDDNVAIDAGTKNITIKRCVFGDGHGCSVGSYTSEVSDVLVDSCSFTNTTSGIRLKSNRDRGGSEQNFSYSNISMKGVKTPIFITSYYPKAPKTPSDDSIRAISSTTPSWKHVRFRNIVATESENGGIIWGLPELSVSDIEFDNVQISAQKEMKINFANGVVFKNGSSVKVTSGTAISSYKADVSGIDLGTGVGK